MRHYDYKDQDTEALRAPVSEPGCHPGPPGAHPLSLCHPLLHVLVTTAAVQNELFPSFLLASTILDFADAVKALL